MLINIGIPNDTNRNLVKVRSLTPLVMQFLIRGTDQVIIEKPVKPYLSKEAENFIGFLPRGKKDKLLKIWEHNDTEKQLIYAHELTRISKARFKDGATSIFIEEGNKNDLANEVGRIVNKLLARVHD